MYTPTIDSVFSRVSLLVLVLTAFSAISGCARFDLQQTHPQSYTLENTQHTRTKAAIAKLTQGQKNNTSGFYLSSDGIEALALRLVLAEGADVSIDVQYYLIKNDIIGKVFTGALLKAADRGVRVRVLLDDIFTQGSDDVMLALHSHPNIEIRLFNPFASRNFRPGDLLNYKQLNRRLHNKSFTVDNQLTIIGGRNIAAEYFGAREDLNFNDLDIVAIGPIVNETSSMFDDYWNSQLSVPVNAVAKPRGNNVITLHQFRYHMANTLVNLEETLYSSALIKDASKFIDHIGKKFTWAPYQLIYDSPEKALGKTPKTSITQSISDEIHKAQESLLIISPYFVPLQSGIEGIKKLQDNNIQVSIVTNSQAANNHLLVHSGYAPYRKKILATGAKLYEAKYDTPTIEALRLDLENSEATLHTKAFVVDDKAFFIGSFNFDPRSADINTELGVMVYSPKMIKSALKNTPQELNEHTYEVTLNHKKQLQWLDKSQDDVQALRPEPNTSAWNRFKVKILSLFPIDSQL